MRNPAQTSSPVIFSASHGVRVGSVRSGPFGELRTQEVVGDDKCDRGIGLCRNPERAQDGSEEGCVLGAGTGNSHRQRPRWLGGRRIEHVSGAFEHPERRAHLSRIRNARQMRNQLRQRPRTIQQRNQVRVDATFDWPVSGVRQQHHLAAAENVQR